MDIVVDLDKPEPEMDMVVSLVPFAACIGSVGQNYCCYYYFVRVLLGYEVN